MELRKEYKNSIYGPIPKDWIESKFEDVFTGFSSGQTPYRAISRYYEGDIPWITSGELNYNKINDTNEKITEEAVRKTNLKIIPKGTFLFAITGLEAEGTRGSCAVTDIEATTNQSCMALFPKPGLVSTDYLFQFYVKYGNWLAFNFCQGTKQQSYTGGIAKKLPIILPPTIEEQTAIATALSDMDNLIAGLEKLIEKKKAIKQGAMQELLRPKEGWVVKTLRELVKYRRGSFPQPYGLDKWYDDISGAPFVQVYDVDDNFKLKDETKRRISKAAQSMSVYIKKGSLIITLQGSIGRMAITQYDAYVDRTLLIFESFIIPFNTYFFALSVFLLFEKEKENAPGGIIKTITKEALSSFPIAYPNLDEQNRIAEILVAIDNEIEQMENRLIKYKMIKSGMMQELLTGKTRLI